MKKLRLVAMDCDKKLLIKRLQRLGCVEIRDFIMEPDKLSAGLTAGFSQADAQARLRETTEAKKRAEAALKVLKKYAYVKSGLFTLRPEIREADFFSECDKDKATGSVKKILSEEANLNTLYNEKHTLETFISSLNVWRDVRIPLDIKQTESSMVLLGAIPAAKSIDEFKAALSAADEETFLTAAGRDKDLQGLVFICSKRAYPAVEDILKSYSFTRAPAGDRRGTAAENIEDAEKNLLTVRLLIESSLNRLTELGKLRAEIQLYIDRLEQEIAGAEAESKILSSERVFALQGWVGEPDIKPLEAILGEFNCAYELTDPQKGDKVPVRLQNNALTRPMNMVTEMYSLPAYEGIDPNPLMLPFYTIFFGMMFNDLGYGLVLIALSLLVQRKAKPRGMLKYMMGLMLLCGITTAVFGVITGSFFGDCIPVVAGMLGKKLALPALLNPIEAPITVMVISLALGVVHILFGMGIKAYMLIRDGQPLDALYDIGSWWLFFAGVAVIALGGTYWVLLAGVAALVLTQGRHKPTIAGKLVGGIASLYNVTSYFGDILSYSRLMALMLAGGIIASIVNILGSLNGSIVFFIIVFIIGHTFNMGINIIGTYVHAARLQYLEFFGKFYVDGGKPFRPLEIKTKYYDIVK
jgi:V/A-type H+-transporting ATPase subunit I